MFSRALTRLSCKKEIPTRHVYIINLRGALNERVRVRDVRNGCATERSDCASHIFENVSGEKGEGKGEIEEKEKKEI